MIDPFDLALQYVILAGVSAILALRGQLTIYHPTSIYLLFHFIVFVMRPTMIYIWDFDSVFQYMRFFPSEEVVETTLLLSSVCLVVFVTVFCLSTHHPSPHRNEEQFEEFSQNERRGFWLMLAILAPAGMYSIFGANVQGTHVGGVFIMQGTSGYLNDLQQVLIPIVILLPLFLKWKWYSFIPLLIFLYFRATQGWGRWTIILTLLALGLLYMWQKRRVLPPVSLILPVPLIFLLFHQMSHNRQYFNELVRGEVYEEEPFEEIDTGLYADEDFRAQWDTLDFANFDYLTAIVAVVPEDTNRYSYGVQHLQMFTEPIPRALWKGKPIGAPVKYFDLNNYVNFLGLTVSIIGDGWMSFGWSGAILNMVMVAFFLGAFYNYFWRNQTSPFVVCAFLIVNALLIQLFRDGSLVSMSKFILFTLVVPFTLWYGFARIVLPQLDKRRNL